MAIIKCKMCGGDIELTADKTFGTCEFCGSTMTLPKIDDDQRAAAFNRGNHFRRIGEFDKALAVYERIVREDDTDAEAHWCCALCRFGIEYVEDPTTYEYLPTCHRASFDSFLEDVDYLAAVEHSDGITKRQYQKDGAKIAEVQRGILATSQNAEPYDVFICYKESDDNGGRTKDSLMAQDIYYQLTEQGRKVFFARITLEDIAGAQYEPYIFAALNSAKVMIVVGTKPEHFNAVWVKNEWSRFLAMMKKDRHKLLLPCYRDMDPYDMPEQLSVLQSYDMAKIGFIQDLTRGIAKVLDAEKKPEAVKETVVVQQSGGTNIAPLLKRAFMFLEDGDWKAANEYCEKVLDIDPENASAYLGKLLSELRVRKQEALKDQAEPFDHNNNYQKAVRFADEKLKTALAGYIEHINTRNENNRLEGIYRKAANVLSIAKTEGDFKEAAALFKSVSHYKDSAKLEKKCLDDAETTRKDSILSAAKGKMGGASIPIYENVLKELESIPGWKDADVAARTCRKRIEEIKAEEEAKWQESKRQAEIVRQKAERAAKRNKKIAIIATPIVCVIAAFIIILNTVIIPNGKYNDAVALMNEGKYQEAIATFVTLDGFRDSEEKLAVCQYNYAVDLVNDGKKQEAAVLFGAAGNYKDAREQSFALWAQIADRETVSAGGLYTVGLKADGTAVAVGDNDDGRCDVSGWRNIVAVSATVGLKADGTVVAVGDNDDGECDVSDWTDIVAVSAGSSHTVGLKADGTVVAVGSNISGQCNVSRWTDIVAVSAGGLYTEGLKADGTAVAVGNNKYGQCDVSDWTDIVAVSAGSYHTVGLKADGTVVAVGDNDDGECDVSDWTDIVAVSAGGWRTVGLKADGTVVAVGDNDDGECDVSGWTDIVAVSAGGWHTVGLKADGTVVAVGSNSFGQCDVSTWKNIRLPYKRTTK